MIKLPDFSKASAGSKYSFPSGKFYLKFRTAGVMGVPRSGKTTLGNLLSTNQNVEHDEEPWLLGALPAMVKLGMINKEVGKDMYIAYLHELMNGMILLHRANFRPNDESSVWAKKTHAEIFSRLVSLQSRFDVKNFVKKNKPLFLLGLSESSLINLPVIFDFLPDCKIVHVVRKGIDVAYQIKEKGHYSDEQLAKPTHAKIYYPVKYKNKTLYIPCWVGSEDIEKFVEYSEYERALFYWCILIEKAIESFEGLGKKKQKQCMIIKFEELIENPRKIMQKASSFLSIKPSSITETALCKIQNCQKFYKKPSKLPKDLFVRTKKLYKYFGYEWN